MTKLRNFVFFVYAVNCSQKNTRLMTFQKIQNANESLVVSFGFIILHSRLLCFFKPRYHTFSGHC